MASWVETYFEQNPDAARLPVVARSRFSLHLRRAGRRRLALITGAPMHYFSSSSREWLPVDTRLQPRGGGGFGAPGLPFTLGLDGSVELKGRGGVTPPASHRHRTWRVGIQTDGRFAETHRFGPAKVDGDRLVRETLNLKLETVLLPGGLREELTLLEPPNLDAGKGDLFVIESLLPAGGTPPGLVLEHLIDGVRFAQGWAQDAQGNRIPLLRWVDPRGQRLYSGVPVDWLAAAAYPVILDPDIDITGSTADGYIEGASVTTSSTFDSGGVAINVGGRNVSGTPKVWRGYVKFNTSSLGPAAAVQRVNLQMFPVTLNNYVAWTIYARQYDWSANDPMATATREAAWDGLFAAANAAVLATSADPVGTPVISQDLPTEWVQVEGNTYYGLWCNQEGYSYPSNQGGQHQYSSADHTTPGQRPLLMVEYLGSYPLAGPVPLRAALSAPQISLPDTRVILRSRARRTALTAPIKGVN